MPYIVPIIINDGNMQSTGRLPQQDHFMDEIKDAINQAV